MIFTKSILLPGFNNDGRRISVMARHTLEDGITPDLRITKDCYDEWQKELAPPKTLVGDYYRRGLSWDQYEAKYISFLRTKEISQKVRELAKRGIKEDVTLLCVEESPERCHRRILAEECKTYEPALKIKHL